MVRFDNKVYLKHILLAIESIEREISKGGKELFDRDKTIQNSIIKELEVVGEACRNLTDEFRGKYPEIPWKDIVGTRDKLIHDYMGVDLERVWLMATIDVPVLKERVKEILDAEGEKLGGSEK